VPLALCPAKTCALSLVSGSVDAGP